jgi:hypothetical protein
MRWNQFRCDFVTRIFASEFNNLISHSYWLWYWSYEIVFSFYRSVKGQIKMQEMNSFYVNNQSLNAAFSYCQTIPIFCNLNPTHFTITKLSTSDFRSLMWFTACRLLNYVTEFSPIISRWLRSTDSNRLQYMTTAKHTKWEGSCILWLHLIHAP